MPKLKKLTLGLRASKWAPATFREFCQVIQKLQTLTFLEIDLRYPEDIPSNDLAMLIFSAVMLKNLDTLYILADGTPYWKYELTLDLRDAMEVGKHLKEAFFSFKSAITQSEGKEISKELKKVNKHCLITVRGNQNTLF